MGHHYDGAHPQVSSLEPRSLCTAHHPRSRVARRGHCSSSASSPRTCRSWLSLSIRRYAIVLRSPRAERQAILALIGWDLPYCTRGAQIPPAPPAGPRHTVHSKRLEPPHPSGLSGRSSGRRGVLPMCAHGAFTIKLLNELCVAVLQLDEVRGGDFFQEGFFSGASGSEMQGSATP